MHIPDGYLSPSTCGGLLALAVPFWYTALRRLKAALHTRAIPLLSVFAAFSFVIMMFNLPLPGGTTGHAVGMGAAAVILGPWASIVAISIALTIQAVFFGDGGITAIGANCFNMAIVGSLVAIAVYRIAARRATIGSARRVAAAGLAGYFSINAAAFCAAIEFGIQPLLFRDATGAPLYAPYPLDISVPAMMIGHLTLAGLAEFVIAAGIIAYLQKSDPVLLCLTAPDAPDRDRPLPRLEDSDSLLPTRGLWLVIAALIAIAPIGILAVGSAWGEWTAQDFGTPEIRQQIAAASGNQAPPARAPRGLQQLSSIWTAPLSRYAPSFIRSASFGYFVSAAIGVAIIIALAVGLNWLLARGRRDDTESAPLDTPVRPGRRRRKSFVEKTAIGLLDTVRHTLFAEEIAARPGLLQGLDARVKLAGLGALILAAVAVRQLSVLSGILVIAVALALLSRVPIRFLAVRVWLAVLAFTGVIALPAIFLTPGTALYSLPFVEWHVTEQGLRSAAFLILRAQAAATISMLLVLTTLWPQLLRAFRFFHAPVVLVAVVGMSYRYMFLLLQTARDMFDSRETRMIGMLQPADRRRLAAAGAGVLLGKTLHVSSEVHTAMQARGFRGEIRLMDEPEMRSADWLRLAGFVAAASAAFWVGR